MPGNSEKLRAYAAKNGYDYHEISAVVGDGVRELVRMLARFVREHRVEPSVMTRRQRSSSIRDMRIGICGGTFDPFHRGHLEPVLAARETMQWDRVLYIPRLAAAVQDAIATTASGYAPLRHGRAGDREHDDALRLADASWSAAAISYTVDTLEELHARVSQAPRSTGSSATTTSPISIEWKRPRAHLRAGAASSC